MRIFLISIAILFTVGGFVIAQDLNIDFPVQELGNCGSEQECFEYCSDPANLEACVQFGVENNLMSAEEGAAALLTGTLDIDDIEGPGECTTQAECEAYCSNIEHIEECISFAREHDLMSPKELEEAEIIANAQRQGIPFPGGCTNEAQCEAYCEDFSHINECLEFAEKVGFLSGQDLREARQVAKAIDAGILPPGGCQGEDECEIYCSEPGHTEECLNFAIAAGFIPQEEQEQARKMMELMANGEMPGACTDRDACEEYCDKEQNHQECSVFFQKAGFMTEQEAEFFLRTGGKGPGGCERDECETFCNNPENQDVCFEFAKENGLISDEELDHIEQGVAQFREGLSFASPEVANCLKDRIGEDVLQKIENGEFTPNPQIGENMRACFDEFSTRGEDFRGEPGDFSPKVSLCVDNIIGDLRGPPSPDMEQRIREECFGPVEEEFISEDFAPEDGEFIPEDFRGLIPQEFERFIPDEINIQDFNEHQEGFIPEGFTPEGIDVQGQIEQFIIDETQRQIEQFVPQNIDESIYQEEFVPDGSDITGSVLNAFTPLLRVLSL